MKSNSDKCDVTVNTNNIVEIQIGDISIKSILMKSATVLKLTIFIN